MDEDIPTGSIQLVDPESVKALSQVLPPDEAVKRAVARTVPWEYTAEKKVKAQAMVREHQASRLNESWALRKVHQGDSNGRGDAGTV